MHDLDVGLTYVLNLCLYQGGESILINDPVLAKKLHDDPRVCMFSEYLI